MSFAQAGKADNRPAVNPWIVALTVTLATFMEILDTSIANVALPHIAGGLSVGLDESTWVLTSYLVANAVVLPLSAWLSRVFGRKRYYMSCVVLFTVSSMLCGLAPSLPWLVFFRVLQGVGGGGLAPCEQAILVDTFPAAQRASAFALYSIAIVVAPAIGPTLGGWITDNFSWHWVFFINVPIGLFSLFATNAVVTDSPQMLAEMKREKERGYRVDWIGILLVVVALGCLEVVLDKGQREDWFESPFILWFSSISLVALVGAIVWELRQSDPVVDLSLLKERNFAIACSFYWLFGIVLLGSTALIPQMVQTLFGYTAQLSGMVVSPAAVVIVLMVPWVVRLLPKIGARPFIAFGFLMITAATMSFSDLNLETDFWHLVRLRAWQGFGLACLFVPVSAVAYSYLPKEKNNKASSLTNLFRNLGGSFGIALVTTFQARRAQFHQARLTENLGEHDPGVEERIRQLQAYFQHLGSSAPDALVQAKGQLSSLVLRQAAIQGYLDVFWLVSWLGLVGVGLVFWIKPFRPQGGAAH